VEGVTGITKNRRAPESLGDGKPGKREITREHLSGLGPAPHISMAEVTQKNHGSLPFAIVAERL
jgi:hypothetical protein